MTTAKEEKKVLAMISVPVPISEEQISNMLCSAYDGAYGSAYYWSAITGYEYPAGKTQDDFEYRFMEVVLAGGKMFLCDAEMTKQEMKARKPEEIEKWTLTREKLIKGLQVMASLEMGKGGHHFPNLMKENDDAETADVFVQCCLFGEIVYG